MRARLLRTYSRTAHQEHFCDCCCRMIVPGESYDRSVEIYAGRFFVFKRHTQPSCDFPPDPDERDFLMDNVPVETELLAA